MRQINNIISDKIVNIGKNIRLYRDMRGISQGEFASMLDISQTSLCNLERAKHAPSTYTMIRLEMITKIKMHKWTEPISVSEMKSLIIRSGV